VISAIHTDQTVQSIDVRLYFDKDLDPEVLLDNISKALQTSADLCDMVSAYQLKNDGFAHLTPDDKPLA